MTVFHVVDETSTTIGGVPDVPADVVRVAIPPLLGRPSPPGEVMTPGRDRPLPAEACGGGEAKRRCTLRGVVVLLLAAVVSGPVNVTTPPFETGSTETIGALVRSPGPACIHSNNYTAEIKKY